MVRRPEMDGVRTVGRAGRQASRAGRRRHRRIHRTWRVPQVSVCDGGRRSQAARSRGLHLYVVARQDGDAGRNRCLRVRRGRSRRRPAWRRVTAPEVPPRRRSCGRSRGPAWHARCALFRRAQGLQRHVSKTWSRNPSKAVRCPLPAARPRSLRPRAGRSARAATAAPRRCSASAAPRRSARLRRAHRPGWRSAIPSMPRWSSTSSAGPVATSARPRCPPDTTAEDHAHPPPRRRAADVEVERRRPHPACPARRAGAAPARPRPRLAGDTSAVAVRPPRRHALNRGPQFSDAAPDASQ